MSKVRVGGAPAFDVVACAVLFTAACSGPTPGSSPAGGMTSTTSASSPTQTGTDGPSADTSGGLETTETTETTETAETAETADGPLEPDVPAQPEDPGEQVVLNRTVFDGTMERTYIVWLPGNYETRRTPARVVIGFHPATSSGAGFEQIARLHEQAGAPDAIVVYPDGDPGQNDSQAWNAGFCCSAADDVAFFDAIVDDLMSLTTIESRVAVTGYSSGAMMVYRLLCDRADELVAAAPFAAYLREQDLTDAQACQWQTPVALMHIHGAEDAQMDPDGQPHGYYPNSGIETPPLVSYMQLVADRNGDAAGSPSESFSPELDSTMVALGNATTYVLIEGLGHTWPGRPGAGQYGPGRTDLAGSEAVMSFLLQP